VGCFCMFGQEVARVCVNGMNGTAACKLSGNLWEGEKVTRDLKKTQAEGRIAEEEYFQNAHICARVPRACCLKRSRKSFVTRCPQAGNVVCGAK